VGETFRTTSQEVQTEAALRLRIRKERMIGSYWKPIDEILGYLEGRNKLVLMGCGGCATVFQTGGEPQVKEMAGILSENGKSILAAIAPPFGEFACYTPQSKPYLEKHLDQLRECDAVLMMSCGDGLQVVRKVMENDLGLVKSIVPALDPVGHMGGGPTLFEEKCQQCGECLLGRTAGICPLTQCAKGLLNGPCGGSKNGKCEVHPERDCAWVLIYERLKALGELDRMKGDPIIKDYGKITRPRSIDLSVAGVEAA
jgi:ferredoxin